MTELEYSCEELKELLVSISNILGFKFEWDDNKPAFQNLDTFFQLLINFLGGAK